MWFSGLMKAGNIDIVSGQFSAVAMVTPAIKKGVAFAEFLHSSQPGNAIAPRVPDPITMNYRYKISSGKVQEDRRVPVQAQDSTRCLSCAGILV